jgi:hypothetical protein
MMMWKATSRDQIKEFQFIRPSEKRGYLLFCDELEDDDTVCFAEPDHSAHTQVPVRVPKRTRN